MAPHLPGLRSKEATPRSSTTTAPSNPHMDLDPRYDDYDFPTTAPGMQSGHPGHTTKEQDAQVHQLRAMLEQAGYKEHLDTLTLLRFLRARKFNVEASKQMFIDCEKWRKEFGADELPRIFDYEEKLEVFKYYPQYYHKTDKEGRPVYIEQLGKIDLTALYKITTAERMLQNLVCEYEKLADPRLPACCRKAGRLLETCCTIMDLKGVGVSQVGSVYSYVRSASAIYQNYYPERLGKLYMINAPWGFSSAFSIVKGFLDPITVQKIHILGSNYRAELLAQVPRENLPREFGGDCECEVGCALSDMGPWQEAKWAKPAKWAVEKGTVDQGEKSVSGEKEKEGVIRQEKSTDGPQQTDGATRPKAGQAIADEKVGTGSNLAGVTASGHV